MALARADQYEVTLIVDGVRIGVFDDFSGGAVKAPEKKYRPGGMGGIISLGGLATVDNIKVTRAFDRARDAELVRFLIDRVGSGRSTAIKQPLDADGNAYIRAFVYTGLLLTFEPSDVKAESQDMDMYTIEVSTDGKIA